MDTIWQDLRYGMRGWRKAPGFTAIVVLTLAFGIGANTTVFAVINTLFLNPLPVARPSELVIVRTVTAGAGGSTDSLPISHPNLQDFRERNQVFEMLAGHSSPSPLTLLTGTAPERIFAELVTGNYFDTLGLQPAKGRFFVAAEDARPGAAPVVVMAHGAWQRRFGGAHDIVGRTLNINGVAFSVVGVAPEGFKGVTAVFGPDVWIPSMMTEQVMPAQMRDWLSNRSALSFHGVARLRPGMTPTQAGANLATIAAALEREHPGENRGRSVAVEPLTRAALLGSGRLSATAISLLLLAIPGLILLIACSNVAGLLLARAASRREEIAVRLAVGAGRSRLVRQLLTESALLALVSGLVGFGLAYAGCQILWSFRPPEVAQNLLDLDVDGTVLLFALVVSVLTGVMFGVAPAWQSARTDIVQTLNEQTRSAGPHRRAITLGRGLLVAQVALSLVSLVTAGLLLRSVQQAYAVDPGFETTRLGIVMVSPGQAGYDKVRSEQFYRDVRARVATIPGVTGVTWATNLPLFSRPSRSFTVEGQEERDRMSPAMTVVNAVDVDYFATTGVTLIRGRDFTEADREGTLPVAIVNETLAARYWPTLDPIGRRLRLTGSNVAWEVVGTAKTANYERVGEPEQPCVYLPLRQQFSDAVVLYVRTEHDPAPILSTVQRHVRGIDSRIEVSDARTVRKIVSQALFGATIGVGLLGVFGLVALALASLGLYGAMAHAIRQRQREIGVRMALGARQSTVLRLILRQGLTVVLVGIGIGLGASLLVGRALAGVLYGVTAADPITVGAASIVLVAAATVACYLPARRASRLDPVRALREA